MNDYKNLMDQYLRKHTDTTHENISMTEKPKNIQHRYSDNEGLVVGGQSAFIKRNIKNRSLNSKSSRNQQIRVRQSYKNRMSSREKPKVISPRKEYSVMFHHQIHPNGVMGNKTTLNSGNYINTAELLEHSSLKQTLRYEKLE